MKRTFFTNVREYFREYCNRTSVHGFQYFGEKKRTIFERIWWFIMFSACLAACTFSIYAVYKKWERSPVIVNFANRGTPIYEIPFPAVTICPEAKSDQNLFNYTKLMHKLEDDIALTPDEAVKFDYMSLICDHNSNLSYAQTDRFSDDFFKVIDEIKPKFQIQDCIYMKVDIDCTKSFVPIMTEDGVCYTFNMLDRDIIFRENVQFFDNYHVAPYNTTDWHLENGYKPDAGLTPYPLRAYLSGVSWGLSFKIVTPNQNLDYACKNSLQGYKVLLHTPMTIPRPNQKYFRIPLDQSVVGAVQPVMITTSDTIKAYNPQRRKCYFAAERKLKFFQDYTSSNCKLECLANWTSDLCSCVNYFMPRDNETDICGSSSVECMELAESFMHMVDLSIKIENLDEKDTKNYDCDCLPVCSDLTYEVETSQTNWEWDKWLEAHRNLPRINKSSHFSALALFFKSDNFITSERNELYGPTDFLANFGGLLGLFTGFSVLSLMEILYFLSIRIVCNIRLYGQWFGTASD